jgi:rhodanese-related sulfurtransferase
MAQTESFLNLVNSAKKNIRECTLDDVLKKREQGHPFHFVDTREDEEWKAGRAQGAVHLGKGVIERDIEAKIPNKADEIILYCGGGSRSALAAEALGKMGYTHVLSMDGGIRDWRARGLPEDRG